MPLRLLKLHLLVGIALLLATQQRLHAADAPALAAKIDQHLAVEWEKAKLTPAVGASDEVFLRRVYLDLVGRIPSVAETRTYIADNAPHKRARLVDQLLASGGHTRHFATFWRRAWVPQADTPEFANLIDDFEAWAAVRGRDNVPYDRMVHELLTITRLPSRARGQQPGERVSPVGFLAASQFKPENLAANTTRSFLGLNLDCAQCHNHPFSRWTRDQFWQTAAFFAPPTKTADALLGKLQLTIPDTERSVPATLLDDKPVPWPEKLEAETGRRLLADWIASKENPYFAKNAVNRIWAHLYGTGLVEPLDDLSEENPPSHPALLDDLSDAFVASGFNVKYLTQAIVLSRAYQLSTTLPGGAADDDPRLFARMPVRGLTGEQLYDSSRVAAGLPVERDDLLTSRDSGQRQRFVTQMLIARPVEAERSIVQALALMNGSLTMELTTAGKSPTLLAAAESPFLNNQGKVETLFFAALNRNPTAQESSRLVNYIEQGGEARTPQQSLADIFWALLNSSEFNTNH